MKVLYTRPDDGGVSIVVAVDKETIEQILGPLTPEQYEAHVRQVSVPAEAVNVKLITDEDIPDTREFRNAWVDVTPDTKVNIDLNKAKDLKLSEMRVKRNALLEAQDKAFLIALDKGDDLEAIRAKKQALRDVTTPLKQLVVEGVDDEKILEQIKLLSVVEFGDQ